MHHNHFRTPAHEGAPAPGQLRAEMRRLLPREAFAPNRKKLLEMALHVALVVVCYRALSTQPGLLASIGLSAVIGHSMLCLGLAGHDLSHNAIVRNYTARVATEYMLWSFLLTSRTVWHVDHNRTHHRHTNTMQDSFRHYADTEECGKTRWFSLLFVPGKHFRFNPFVFLTYLVHMIMHTVIILKGNFTGSKVVTNLDNLGPRERLFGFVDVLGIVAMQVGVFYLAGGDWRAWLWATPVASLWASAGSSFYLYTQHSLFPLTESAHPLDSTSLRMPRWLDALHSNVSHHAAHHVFPGLNSSYYPQLTELLAKHYPAFVHIADPWDCWLAVQQGPLFKKAPASVSRPDTNPLHSRLSGEFMGQQS
jgi:fatty acid desaturase